MFVKDLEKLQFLQTIKGWLFISLSSILLYLLINKYSKDLQNKKNHLKKVNNILEEIIENAPIIIFWKNRNGVYLGCNSSFLNLMELKNKNELIGKKDSDFQISEKENFMEDDNLVMSSKQPKLNYIETITTKNNGLRIVNTSKVPLYDENQNVIGILGVTQDITENIKNQNQIKSQEELLIQQSKLASMGEMIAFIAHQWRQPLSVISTLSTGLKLQKELNLSNEENEKEILDNINNNAQYLSKTIDDFKNFFKKSEEKIEINSSELFEKTLNLVYSRLKTRDIEIIIQDNEIDFETYENEIIQVLINIINNSIDAFENIKTKKFIFIDINKNENKIILQIKDNAGGIKEEIINKIFDPYFTTKDKEHGTGLGLYMSKEIITKHLNGKIEVSNTNFTYLDQNYFGTLFIITLPLTNN
jgi:PAS domain S-box-containing protein